MSYFRELRDLEDQGIDLIEVLGQDRHLESPEVLQKIIDRLTRSGDNIYAELLHYLTYRRFTAEQAESIWRGIMRHKGRLAAALGRHVVFRVAALDYLSTRNIQLRHVRLIAKPEFESILSYVNVDEVTGIFNRRYFNDSLAQEFHRARRYASPLSLLIVDIDDFKAVNDAFGHLEGDAVLRRVGRLLRDSTRQPDVVCRYGGDEFAVILPETDGADARTLAERIRRAPSRVPLVERREDSPRWPSVFREGRDAPAPGPAAEAKEASLTFSIGGATFPTDCDEAEELVALADQHCLDAKRQGKNRVLMAEGGGGLSLAAE